MPPNEGEEFPSIPVTDIFSTTKVIKRPDNPFPDPEGQVLNILDADEEVRTVEEIIRELQAHGFKTAANILGEILDARSMVALRLIRVECSANTPDGKPNPFPIDREVADHPRVVHGLLQRSNPRIRIMRSPTGDPIVVLENIFKSNRWNDQEDTLKIILEPDQYTMTREASSRNRLSGTSRIVGARVPWSPTSHDQPRQQTEIWSKVTGRNAQDRLPMILDIYGMHDSATTSEDPVVGSHLVVEPGLYALTTGHARAEYDSHRNPRNPHIPISGDMASHRTLVAPLQYIHDVYLAATTPQAIEREVLRLVRNQALKDNAAAFADNTSG